MKQVHTSGDMTAGNAYFTGCTIEKAEYGKKNDITLTFTDCTIGELISWNVNTTLNNCKVTTLDKSRMTTATLIIDGTAQKEASKQEELVNAVGSADKVEVNLSAGDYTMPSTSSDVTISGTKDTVIEVPFKGVSGNSNVITFVGVTIKGETNSSWYSEAFNGAEKVVYKDCVIYDQLTTYADVEFINCTFYNTFDNDYSVYCYSGKNISFEGCTFNTNCGKAIKVYDEGNGGRTVTVNGCTFNAENYKKAAVEIDSTYSTYYVYINNCTLKGAFTAAWNSDAGEDARTNVCLDGTWVKGNAPA